jgi:hypothetical protein
MTCGAADDGDPITPRGAGRRRFLHALNFCMAIPGPEAQQLASYVGYSLYGVRGSITSGGLFVLPSFVLPCVMSGIQHHRQGRCGRAILPFRLSLCREDDPGGEPHPDSGFSRGSSTDEEELGVRTVIRANRNAPAGARVADPCQRPSGRLF